MARVDPVCGMELDEEDAEVTSQYKGQEFYFCSAECKQQFDQNPEQFARMTA
jgi:P-type Cu+ transporter